VIDEKLASEFNKQINAELYSSYLYLSMAAYFDALGLRGFSSWMKAQAEEELGHAMKIFDYLSQRGGRVILGPIEAPPTEWESPRHAVEALLEHEKKVTAMINSLVALARQLNDYAAEVFLHWFVEEQVEEEASAQELLDMLSLAGDRGHSLLMIDRHLAERKPKCLA